jgi:hypothetical protein
VTVTRAKAKGRRGGERGERFARMTESLLQHPSVTTLHHAAFRLLTILAVGAWPPGIDKRQRGNNGTQAVTDSYARRYGVNSRDTVYSALKALKERGLIVQTREGWRNKSHFSLYAVGWLPITHRDGIPLDSPEPAPNAWEQWRSVQEKKKTPSGARTSSSPKNGQDQSICRPIDPSGQSVSGPTIGNTLRHLGTHTVTGTAAAGSLVGAGTTTGSDGSVQA